MSEHRYRQLAELAGRLTTMGFLEARHHDWRNLNPSDRQWRFRAVYFRVCARLRREYDSYIRGE